MLPTILFVLYFIGYHLSNAKPTYNSDCIPCMSGGTGGAHVSSSGYSFSSSSSAGGGQIKLPSQTSYSHLTDGSSSTSLHKTFEQLKKEADEFVIKNRNNANFGSGFQQSSSQIFSQSGYGTADTHNANQQAAIEIGSVPLHPDKQLIFESSKSSQLNKQALSVDELPVTYPAAPPTRNQNTAGYGKQSFILSNAPITNHDDDYGNGQQQSVSFGNLKTGQEQEDLSVNPTEINQVKLSQSGHRLSNVIRTSDALHSAQTLSRINQNKPQHVAEVSSNDGQQKIDEFTFPETFSEPRPLAEHPSSSRLPPKAVQLKLEKVAQDSGNPVSSGSRRGDQILVHDISEITGAQQPTDDYQLPGSSFSSFSKSASSAVHSSADRIQPVPQLKPAVLPGYSAGQEKQAYEQKKEQIHREIIQPEGGQQQLDEIPTSGAISKFDSSHTYSQHESKSYAKPIVEITKHQQTSTIEQVPLQLNPFSQVSGTVDKTSHINLSTIPQNLKFEKIVFINGDSKIPYFVTADGKYYLEKEGHIVQVYGLEQIKPELISSELPISQTISSHQQQLSSKSETSKVYSGSDGKNSGSTLQHTFAGKPEKITFTGSSHQNPTNEQLSIIEGIGSDNIHNGGSLSHVTYSSNSGGSSHYNQGGTGGYYVSGSSIPAGGVFDAKTLEKLFQSGKFSVSSSQCPECGPMTGELSVIKFPADKKEYGLSTSFSKSSKTINGQTSESRKASVTVNDNGNIQTYENHS